MKQTVTRRKGKKKKAIFLDFGDKTLSSLVEREGEKKKKKKMAKSDCGHYGNSIQIDFYLSRRNFTQTVSRTKKQQKETSIWKGEKTLCNDYIKVKKILKKKKV